MMTEYILVSNSDSFSWGNTLRYIHKDEAWIFKVHEQNQRDTEKIYDTITNQNLVGTYGVQDLQVILYSKPHSLTFS